MVRLFGEEKSVGGGEQPVLNSLVSRVAESERLLHLIIAVCSIQNLYIDLVNQPKKFLIFQFSLVAVSTFSMHIPHIPT